MPAPAITHLFVSGRSQTIRIPKEYRFADDEELVLNRIGDSTAITPKKALASLFISCAGLLDDGFMTDGRHLEFPAVREVLDQYAHA